MIIFIHGDDEFSVKRELATLLEKTKEDLEISSEQAALTVRPTDEAPERLFAHLETLNMFQRGTAAVLEDVLRFRKPFREELLEYLKRRDVARDPAIALFVTHATGGERAQEADSLLAFLRKKPVRAVALTGQRSGKREKVLMEEARALGLTLEPDAKTALLRLHGENLREIVQELRKLALYLASSASQSRRVRQSDVTTVGWEHTEEDAWRLVQAMGRKDHAAMLKVLLRAFQSGQDELKLLGLVTYVMRAMLVVKDAASRRIHPHDIPRLAKLAPFQVRQYLAASDTFSLEELKKTYERLLATDFKIKTGEGKARTLLERFLLAV